MTDQQQATLAERMDEAENPDWFLTQFAMVVEEKGITDETFDDVLAATVEYNDQQPQPPATEEDKVTRIAADSLALDEYMGVETKEEVEA